MTYRNSAALTALSALLMTAPAFAGEMDKSKTDMSKKEVFMKIDTDSDSKLTFTEFANFSENHGMSTSAAAQEFSRLAGQETTINMESFADFDMAGLEKTNMKSATEGTIGKMSAPDTMRADSVQTYENQPEAVLDRTITTSSDNSTAMSSEYGEFAALDSNSDGNLSFKEFYEMRKEQGVSSATQAAQEFTRLSNGQTMITADQYQVSTKTQAEVSPSGLTEPDWTEGTQTRQDFPLDNNPAGLNQMNNPDEMSNMTNSGAETDLDKTSNPQMKVWGEK